MIAKATAAGDVEIWPENWPAFCLFASVGTQWTAGTGGYTGLRYEAVYPLLDRVAKSPQEWDEMFADVQTMERAALQAMRDE